MARTSDRARVVAVVAGCVEEFTVRAIVALVKWATRRGRWWRAQYQCGCMNRQKRKKDLPGYCCLHGDKRYVLYSCKPDDDMRPTPDRTAVF